MAAKPGNTKPSEATANTRMKLPTGHYDADGRSLGTPDGEGRKTHDAFNTNRDSGGEKK